MPAQEKLVVLCIDDTVADAEMLRFALDQVPGLNVEFRHQSDPERGLEELDRNNIDFLFLDYQVGSTNGIDVLKVIRERGYIQPVIVMTRHGDEHTAAAMIRAGADEFIIKDDLSVERLQRTLYVAEAQHQHRRGERELHNKVQELERQLDRLSSDNVRLSLSARIDPLTLLLNRRAWEESAWLEHQRARRSGTPYAIIMIDIDHFKAYNDNCGHQKGDDCLRRVAAQIVQVCRCTDLVGRYGGEEFIVLAPETNIEQADVIAERVRNSVFGLEIAHPASAAERVTVSLGIASGSAEPWQQLAARADQALYEAKAEGRNRVQRPHGVISPAPAAGDSHSTTFHRASA